MSTYWTGLEGFEFCQRHLDETNEYFLFTNKYGIGYIKRAALTADSLIKFSKLSPVEDVWLFSTKEPKSKAEGDYYFWHNHPNNK